MKPSDLVLACGPPLLAILIQLFPIPNDRWLAREASNAQSTRRFPLAAATVIRETAKGAVAVAGLTPTLISYLTGAFALFATTAENHPDFVGIYLCVVIGFGAVALVAIALLLGRTLFGIASSGIRIPILHFGPTPARLLGWIVYLLNGLLIVLAILIYTGRLPHWG